VQIAKSPTVEARLLPLGKGTYVMTTSAPSEVVTPLSVLVDQQGNRFQIVQRLGETAWCCASAPHSATAAGRWEMLSVKGSIFALDLAQVETLLDEAAGAWRVRPGERVETGIKAIDLFAPIERGARVLVSGGPGAGRFSALRELFYRLRETDSEITIAYAIVPHDALLLWDEILRDPLVDRDVTTGCRLLWIPLDDAKEPRPAISELFDVVLYFSPLLAFRNQFPALDPLQAFSRARETDPEAQVAVARAKQILTAGEIVDREFVRLVALGLEERAIARWDLISARLDRLGQKARCDVRCRALALNRFLGQPFYTASVPEAAGVPSVPYRAALADLQTLVA
jgi:hypothetical protein